MSMNEGFKGLFTWWRIMPDGTAEAEYDDDVVNANPRNVFGNVEGAIIHGGVRATAFERKTEKTYDARAYFTLGIMREVGEVTITTITAERE